MSGLAGVAGLVEVGAYERLRLVSPVAVVGMPGASTHRDVGALVLLSES